VVDKANEKASQEENLGKRKLKKEVSDASLDEDGFPKCFSSPITKVLLPTKTKCHKQRKKSKKLCLGISTLRPSDSRQCSMFFCNHTSRVPIPNMVFVEKQRLTLM